MPELLWLYYKIFPANLSSDFYCCVVSVFQKLKVACENNMDMEHENPPFPKGDLRIPPFSKGG